VLGVRTELRRPTVGEALEQLLLPDAAAPARRWLERRLHLDAPAPRADRQHRERRDRGAAEPRERNGAGGQLGNRVEQPAG
jgi:hypothetical protein